MCLLFSSIVLRIIWKIHTQKTNECILSFSAAQILRTANSNVIRRTGWGWKMKCLLCRRVSGDNSAPALYGVYIIQQSNIIVLASAAFSVFCEAADAFFCFLSQRFFDPKGAWRNNVSTPIDEDNHSLSHLCYSPSEFLSFFCRHRHHAKLRKKGGKVITQGKSKQAT